MPVLRGVQAALSAVGLVRKARLSCIGRTWIRKRLDGWYRRHAASRYLGRHKTSRAPGKALRLWCTCAHSGPSVFGGLASRQATSRQCSG